jgi:hypothetical protein
MVRVEYCCAHPRLELFLDDNGGPTAVVYCAKCQRIACEICRETGVGIGPFSQEHKDRRGVA